VGTGTRSRAEANEPVGSIGMRTVSGRKLEAGVAKN
jgi:hypothetical protein